MQNQTTNNNHRLRRQHRHVRFESSRHRLVTLFLSIVAILCLGLYNQSIALFFFERYHDRIDEMTLDSVGTLLTYRDHARGSIKNNTYFDAVVAKDGSSEYRADPYALKKSQRDFLKEQQLDWNPKEAFWNTMQYFQNNEPTDSLLGKTILSPEYICAFGPGQGLEEEGGYKMLTEKIKVASTESSASSLSSPRILCAVYTHDKMRPLARAAALTWGLHCDGFLAFSTETIKELGMMDLKHQGQESYGNMWQKTRSILAYLHAQYLHQFDYFHIGGDDMYVIVDNLRLLVNEVQHRLGPRVPVYVGQEIQLNQQRYIAGGGGYTLNRLALDRLVDEALPHCHTEREAAYEDRLVTTCLRSIGIESVDSRDQVTGEQRYHDQTPHHLFTSRSATSHRASFHSRASAYWETQWHPSFPNRTTVGPRFGLDAASASSVSFHGLYNPFFMTRFHAILYRLCASDTVLGSSLE